MPFDLPNTPQESAQKIRLPALAANTLPEPTTDQELKDQLIHLLATSYVRREGRFYHIDRPGTPFAREDLQRSFISATQHLTRTHPNPTAIYRQAFNTAIIEMNADPNRSIPV